LAGLVGLVAWPARRWLVATAPTEMLAVAAGLNLWARVQPVIGLASVGMLAWALRSRLAPNAPARSRPAAERHHFGGVDQAVPFAWHCGRAERWRRRRVVARVVVPLEVFQRGQLPAVCIKTGRPAELVGQAEVVAAAGVAWWLVGSLPVVKGLWPAADARSGMCR
jgi:hypothetical protein